jgi:hypothetical protein
VIRPPCSDGPSLPEGLVPEPTPRPARSRNVRRHFGRSIRTVVSIGVACGLGVVAGSAFAYYTTAGSGTGQVTAGSLTQVTIAATGTNNNSLFPGQTGDIVMTINNPNGQLTITSIQQNGTLSVTGGNGCTAANSQVSVPLNNTLNVNLPSGNGNVIEIPGAVSMGTSSNNGCQGAMFIIPVTITVQKG